jgi:hypothetical protein
MNMTESALANLYGRINWGQSITNNMDYIHLDEACISDGSPDTGKDFSNTLWRVYDYGLLRNINQFLKNVRESSLDNEYKMELEGQTRFIRAWLYFNMARCLGGMPLIGDEVFVYTSGMDIAPMQHPRSTEEAIYNYIISECDEIVRENMLSGEPAIHAAKANKWAALALKSRAAIYAASIAKYNNRMVSPVQTDNREVGIPADKANGFYTTALEAAEEIIKGGKYRLQDSNPDKGMNFYEAVSIKSNNVEVIWAVDYKYPGNAHQFTTANIPVSVREDKEASTVTPVLNLVEAFEYKNDRDGSIKTKDSNGEYIFYDKPQDAFKDKDARLYGTVIYPGSTFRGKVINYQTGRKYLKDGMWADEIGRPGSADQQTGEVITNENGPVATTDKYTNKSGFDIRKFMDETKSSGTIGRGSEIWFVRMRYAEVLLTAAEAAMELGQTAKALGYINQVRSRAGIQELTAITLDDIVRERYVEFAFENHRYWDLKRWRLADKLWDGEKTNPNAVHYVLFPFVINQPGHPAHGKWVFDKKECSATTYPRNFQLNNYYNFIDNNWINNNPKMVRNPFQ